MQWQKIKDQFKRIDKAIAKIRTEVDDVTDGGKSTGGKASKEVRKTIDSLETR